VLTAKSGLDPHMINEPKDGFYIAFLLFLWPCWVPTISVLILAKPLLRKKKKVYEVQKMVLGVHNPSRLPVKFGAFASQDSTVNLW
jgi:hypothetical protein